MVFTTKRQLALIRSGGLVHTQDYPLDVAFRRVWLFSSVFWGRDPLGRRRLWEWRRRCLRFLGYLTGTRGAASRRGGDVGLSGGSFGTGFSGSDIRITPFPEMCSFLAGGSRVH